MRRAGLRDCASFRDGTNHAGARSRQDELPTRSAWMNRRDFIAGSAAGAAFAAAAPSARAQQDLPVIGVLDRAWGLGDEVHRGLEQNGCSAGRDFRLASSGWSGSGYRVDQLALHAARLVERKVTVMLAFSNHAAAAASSVTDATPIIFLADNHLADALVDRASGSGGNLTGAA